MSDISPEFIARLFEGHAAALELFAAQWADSPADVVQDAFIQLVKQQCSPEHPIAWLYQVVRNRAISCARSEGRRQRRESSVGSREWFVSDDHDQIDAKTAAAALESLPLDQREVVIARIWGGLTLEEVAEVLDSSTSTVHRRYESALLGLRERLGVTWLKTMTTAKS
jgi:RNA polymerase sigma factor (sigma-70 family)